MGCTFAAYAHRPHVSVLVCLYPLLGRVGRGVTAHRHTAIVLVLVNTYLSFGNAHVTRSERDVTKCAFMASKSL